MLRKLFTICLVLLLCVPAYGTKVSAADDSTAIAAVQTDVDLIEILNEDIMAHRIAGDTFYVNSNASGSDTGLDWTNAALTIEAGIALCTAAAGDWIMVHPAHAETASTGTVDADKTDVTIWGLRNGTAMPTLTYDTSTDTFIIGATGDGTKVHGIKFISSVTAVASAIVVEAGCTDFVIEDCVFEAEATTVDEFIDTIYITGTASDRGIIRRNRFLGDVGANAGPKASINFIDCDFLQIYENEFSGDIGDAHIFNETTASNYVTIRDNRIICGYIGGNLDVTPGISLVATTTGWIANNIVVTNVASPDLAIVAADCYLVGNSYQEVQGSETTGFGNIGKVNIAYAATGTMDSTNYGAGTAPIFTVTGDILCRAIGITVTNMSSDSNETIELGVTGDTACLLVQDIVDGTAFRANDVWTLDEASDTPSAEVNDAWVVIPNGLDIGLLVDDADMAAGTMEFYLEWIALSPDASVVAAAL